MILFKKVLDLQKYLNDAQIKDLQIGFVPTMGALHNGHISLIKASKIQCDITLCSIFVNPTQFNDVADFNQYPTTIENDMYVLEKNGCDVVFLPSVEEIYSKDFNKIYYELGFLETVLEGKFRPNHFQGVCQVVHRLLNIVAPNKLFMGQKDYQQCMVIKKLITIIKSTTQLIICPTQREGNGLAMSSRNMRLNEKEKKNALYIYESINTIKKELQPGNIVSLKEKATKYLIEQNFKVDYIEIADAETLELITNWNGETQLVILAAAFLDSVRLIDNLVA